MKRAIAIMVFLCVACAGSFWFLLGRDHDSAMHKRFPADASKVSALANSSLPSPRPKTSGREAVVPVKPVPYFEKHNAFREIETDTSSLTDRPQMITATRPAPEESAELSYQSSMAIIHSKPLSLSAEDTASLREFLNIKLDDQTKLNSSAFNALKNDALTKLLDQTPIAEGLGQQLVDMYNDPYNDPLWKDYCIQHMAIYYQAKWPEGHPAKDTEAASLIETCWSAANENNSSIAGAALIALDTIAESNPNAVDPAKVLSLAYSYARNDNANLETRTTAVQMCGRHGRSEILPAAKKLAADTSTRMPLRMSAIATVGDLGSRAEIGFLSNIAESSDGYIRKAAEMAMWKVTK